MGKAMSSVFSEIFVNNLFELNSYACRCEKDIKNVAPGEPPETTLKLYSMSEKPIHFSYSDSDGLNLTGDLGRIQMKNVLGQVLALKENDVDSYIKLIQKIGFILPVSFENYEAVDMKSLIEIINRIKATIQLMNAIDGKTPYEQIRMFNAMTFLLYRDPVTLNLESGQYVSCPHALNNLINNSMMPRDFRGDNDSILDNGNYSVSDSVAPGGKAEVSSELFNKLQMGSYDVPQGQASSCYRNLFFAYTSAFKEQEEWGPVVDFYMNYQNHAGIIDRVDIDRITYYSPDAAPDFNDELKAALPKVARKVLSDEINHNINNIHMQYDGEGLAPRWQIDTLLQALYFSIFYMKPGVKMYKRCKNVNCKRDIFFLTNRTKTNKDYCCDQCRSAAYAREKRHEKKEAQS